MDIALLHHFFQIAQTQAVSEVPAHAQQNVRSVEMAACERLISSEGSSEISVCDKAMRGRSEATRGEKLTRHGHATGAPCIRSKSISGWAVRASGCMRQLLRDRTKMRSVPDQISPAFTSSAVSACSRVPETMISRTSCSSVFLTWRSPTYSPRLSTITRSPTAKMSTRRCEMMI